MLTIVGAGLGPGSLTPQVRKAVEEANVLIIDSYTSPFSSWIIDAVKSLGKQAMVASRESLEDKSSSIISMASSFNVAVIVPGDPMVATTHASLLVEAKLKGIKVKIIPGISGPCASMSTSGLQFYRFGRKMTIPGPWRGVGATSTAYWLLGNMCLDLHTLLLLDVSPDGGQLPPAEGVKALKDQLDELVGDEWKGFRNLLVLAISVSDDDVKVSYSSISDPELLAPLTPSTLIVPSRLHPVEREFLETMHGVPKELLDRHDASLRSVDPCGLFLRSKQKAFE
ncbi:MAG: SAM-dependent methyltransferase [Acidilobus sp.]